MKAKKTFHLNIFGDKVKVVNKPNLNEKGLYGLCDSDNKIIYYGSHKTKDEEVATIIHEIIHHVVYRTGIRQTSLDADMEELFAENISRAISENFNISLKKKK